MQTVPIIFGKSHKLAGYVIRLFSWSRWTHCAIIDGDNVIEAAFPAGVTITPLVEFKQRYGDGNWKIVNMPCDNCKQAIERAKSQLGKSYDLIGVIGLGLRRTKWDDKRRWWCSELVAHCGNVFRHDRVSRVTPEHVWMISK